MRLRPVPILSYLAVLSVGCGGSGVHHASAVDPHVVVPPTNVPVAPAEPQPKEALARADVHRTVQAGLGRFLSLVELDASLEAGHFVGWKILALKGPPGLWDGVDLRPGDVVTSVNGFRLEREWEADRAFRSLEVASELRVRLLRAGAPIELRFAIVDESNSAEPAHTSTGP